MFTSTSLLVPRVAKSWAGSENEATHPLDLWTAATQVSEIWCVISVK